MFLYYKQAHKTHLLLIAENEKIIENYETINYGHLFKIQSRLNEKKNIIKLKTEKPKFGIAVDGFCSGNPGPCGYKGIDLETGEQLFINKHLGYGTNNIAEFIAIVHGLMYCKKHGKHNVVYSDSEIALVWIKMKKANSTLDLSKNPELAQKLWHSEMWVLEQKRLPNYEKWLTSEWGEVPADFGNKK